MYKLSKHREEIITNLLSNFIWYLLTIIFTNILLWLPLIKGIYISIKNNTYNIPVYALILVGISILFMFALLIVIVINSNKFYQIKTDLIFNELEIELFFKDRENILTFLKYDCTVNKENFDHLTKNIIWTGDKYNYTKIIESNGEYSLTDSTRKSSPHNYTINFNKSFSIGEKVYFKLETSVTDNDLSMTPVFSHMIKQQTINFTINLTVPKNLIKNIRPAVYRDISRTIAVPNNIQLKQKNVGNLIQYSFSIENPKLLNNYCIEWDF